MFKHLLAVGLFAAAVASLPAADHSCAPQASVQPPGEADPYEEGALDADGRRTVVLYTSANAPAAPRLEDLPLKASVSQYGITWTFEKPARVGQFINGDW